MLSCPYCNAQVSVTTPPVAGQRLPCPRCGEMFPVTVGSGQWAVGSQTEPTPKATVPTDGNGVQRVDQAPRPRRWSNRAIAWTMLSIMCVMALIALAYALSTEQVRRAHDLLKPPKTEILQIPLLLRMALGIYLFALAFILARGWFRRHVSGDSGASGWKRYVVPAALTVVGAVLVVLTLQPRRNPEANEPDLLPVRAVPPAELAGLGYVPDDVDVVAGLHVAQALETPAGRELLDHFQVGRTDIGMASFEKWTGLKRQELDHVVLGLHVSGQLLPAITLVIETRRPYDVARVRAAFPAKGHAKPTNKPLHATEIKVNGVGFEALVWFADARALVVFVGVESSKINAVPDLPPSGAGRLAEPLQTLLRDRERIDPESQLWIVGRTEGWDKLLWRPFSLLPKDWREPMANVRRLGAWMRLDEDVKLGLAFECADAAVGRALAEKLRPAFPQVSERDTWLTAERKVTPAEVRDALGQVRPELGGR